jgi:phosphoglycerate dehydrogenase-like enzyme
MLKIFNATQTLKGFNQELEYTVDKSAADLMIVGGKSINLDEFPNLRGIFKTGVGIDNLPFKEAEKRGVVIQLPSEETKEIIYHETASFALHLILKFVYRDTGIFSTWQKNNRKSLKDYQVLVMGTGKIGSKLVDRLSPLCKVLTYDPLDNTEEELDQYLQKADIISLHMPLLPETKNFFNQEKLSLLKNGALLVNTARGPIIEEEALYNELKGGRIKAAIDVFSKEPYEGKLTEIDSQNIYLSPHVASTCKEFLVGLAKDFLAFHSKFN